MSDRSSPAASGRPFIAAPDASRYFPSAVAEEARQRISRAIARGEGPALLIGAAGTGKSLLLAVLAEQFGELREIVPLAGAQICTRRALLQTILFQLDLPYKGIDEGELRLSLLEHLEPGDMPPRRLLLLVDEADSLPLRLLEELRTLSNVSRGGESLVNLVLAGSPILEERFADPQLTAFSQRISTRCYLAAMGRDETFQYVRAQVAATGMDPDTLFAQDALEAIFSATDGLPRLVNQLGDQLVWMAHESSETPLVGETVQRAWSELQQLPAPWNTPPVETVAESVVEFGELSDEDDFLSDDVDDDLPASIPISVKRTDEAEMVETFDATAELLGQIELLDSSSSDSDQDFPQAEETTVAYDPFEEKFGSEEIVLDQYLAFECELLATAPRVINRLDTAFAGQLKDFLLPEITTKTKDSAVDSPSPNLGPLDQDDFDTELDPEEDDVAEALPATVTHARRDPGEILVVEDVGRPQVKLVPGRKYRQLFSSLQSQSRIG